MKKQTTISLMAILVASTWTVYAQEDNQTSELLKKAADSEFSKELQRKAAEALWELGKRILKDAATAKRPQAIKFESTRLSPLKIDQEPMDMMWVQWKSFENLTKSPIKNISLHIWSCGKAYDSGEIDGVLIGSYSFDDVGELKAGENLTREHGISVGIDYKKALQIQSLKGKPQMLVVAIGGQGEADDKPYLKAWENFAAYDFVTLKSAPDVK